MMYFRIVDKGDVQELYVSHLRREVETQEGLSKRLGPLFHGDRQKMMNLWREELKYINGRNLKEV